MSFTTPQDVSRALAGEGYLADQGLATSAYLAFALEQPLLLEGEAGVGKTEVARALAGSMGASLIRLQCHEGIDLHHAVYDWDYQRQLLSIRAAEAGAAPAPQLFSREFLLRRPLLDALEASEPVVLLIDEIDRSDDEFEAFLLEFLSDFQVSIPELGTISAQRRPLVVITSNRTRELHDALKRRCLYHWIDYPDAARELAILAARAPEVPPRLAAQIVAFVHQLRATDLFKLPGVAETLDWGQALVSLGCVELDPETVNATLGVLLKYQDDLARISGAQAATLVATSRGTPQAG